MSNFNSMEAFAEWFDENIKSLEECESEGVDIECEMKKWCENNNHDYNDYDDSRRIGVYNNNIDDNWTCEYCGDKINNEIKNCGCKWETGYLETKCGCEIIVNSREHDECRCDDDGENWICSECYNGEYDENDESPCPCEYCGKIHPFSECEYEEENALGCCSECAEELVEGYWWSRPERGLRFCAYCGESVLKEEEEL